METTYAAVLAIGAELTQGRTLDTNSHWLAGTLGRAGFPLSRITVVTDHAQAIVQGLQQSLAVADLVVVTGGLGPTKDDITKKVLADFFGMTLAEHAPTRAHLEEFYRRRGRPLNERAATQALQPTGAQVFQNPVGSAPGMLFSQQGPRGMQWVFCTPGVPHEMKALVEQYLIPQASQALQPGVVHEAVLRTACIPETVLAQRIADIEDALPPHIALAYNPGLHAVDLRLTLTTSRAHAAEYHMQWASTVEALKARLGTDVYATTPDVSLAQVVGQLLTEKNTTLAVAESCTGGLLLSTLTAVPGASAYLRGGWVPYANEAKVQELGVPPELIAQHGAVSEPVALALARQAAARLGTHYALSTTGVAGPEGGTPEKPVGTVWIGLHTPQGTQAVHHLLENHRVRNQQRTVVIALELLRQDLVK